MSSPRPSPVLARRPSNARSRAGSASGDAAAAARTASRPTNSPRGSPSPLQKHDSFEERAGRRGIDRSDWITRVLKSNPAVEDIRDRLSPLARAVSFAELYNKGRGRATMPTKLVTQLVLQYLDREGLKSAQRSLEKESGAQLEVRDVEDARLLTLLQMIIRDVDQLWDLTIHDKDFLLGKLPMPTLEDEKDGAAESEDPGRTDNISGDALRQALEEALTSVRLLREDDSNLQADVNIWDEPPGNIIFESDEKASSQSVSPPASPRGFVPEGTAVVAGSLNRLVEHLCPSGSVDLNYVKCFLTTYHWFCKPETLLLKLIQRYNAPREEGITEAEYKRKVMSIQLRVINALREWISAFFEDLDDALLTNLKDFLTFSVSQDHPKPAKTLLQIIDSRQASKLAALVTSGSASESALVAATGAFKDVDLSSPSPLVKPGFDFGDEEAPRPIVPKNIFSPTLSWLDVEEEELARQLTLIEFDIFYRIQTSELLQQSWMKPKLKHRAPNVLAMIARFNNVSAWMGTVICQEDKIRNRARVMQKLVGVAEHLRKLNNFNTLMAFVAIFGNSAIYRLKHTKSELPPKSLETLDELTTLMSSDDGFRSYRETLERTIGVPAIPYLGIFLTDLTFAEEGNADTHMGLINFRKSRSLYSIISRIQQLQQKGYNLHPVHQIQAFLRDPQPRWNEKELFRKSGIIEPRGADRAQIE